ncbi:GTP-binding protein TypA [Thermincola ferriacetica]|uniref:Large ribosomal subunit assembly factor BipA n=1 Tax=Thermincola ferriacetica TaxID=281456 RepID=A0A0L6W0U1_9FIRM|nr:translational GTPase TypA [Thermincola ferriacetica]KNZ68699.1 GTP-binding protein TypA [Thermincola ferriacetica]
MKVSYNQNIRNVAIIAHVDHGKTTLVDCLLRQSGIFRDNEVIQERVMDSNDLERERGITILAKNTAVSYKNIKINIVDTPGHADFGGEVERALSMVDGVLLVVDAFEGPMPQTKFVLRKALEANLHPIVVVNKADRADARPHEVIDEVFDLFLELGASDEQLDFPIIYASAREGWARKEIEDTNTNMEPLFEAIINHIQPPACIQDGPFQMLVANLEYDNYLGKYAVGRIKRGIVSQGENIAVIKHDGTVEKGKVAKLFIYSGLKRIEVTRAEAGDIIAVAGLTEVNIGETLADANHPEQLPVITVDEPTLTMTFMVNNSPFAGQDGEFITSRKLRERLYRELDSNVSLRVEDTDSPDAFQVSGRGELHLSILIENMRREGYEMQVSKPEVIYKTIDGKLMEPMEHLVIDIPEDCMGPVMENLGRRKAEMLNMVSTGNGQVRIEFNIPARGLIGFRGDFLTETRGRGIMNHTFNGYEPYKGDIQHRYNGALIAWETGEATTYGMLQAEERGLLFIQPGMKVYEGMIVGMNNRDKDLEVNVCKKKHLTNMRASTAEETVKLKEPRILSLEEAIEFINEDELVEITPNHIRMRKKVLDKNERAKYNKQVNMMKAQ